MPKGKPRKTIEISVQFLTDKLNISKHCWDKGFVYVPKNVSHKIAFIKGDPFSSLCELPKIIEDMLIKAKIKVHPRNRAKKIYTIP